MTDTILLEGINDSTFIPLGCKRTFVIYLMHYPMLVLTKELGFIRLNAFMQNVCAASLISLLLTVVAPQLEKLKNQIRDLWSDCLGTESATVSGAAIYFGEELAFRCSDTVVQLGGFAGKSFCSRLAAGVRSDDL